MNEKLDFPFYDAGIIDEMATLWQQHLYKKGIIPYWTNVYKVEPSGGYLSVGYVAIYPEYSGSFSAEPI
jgi:hypothetical protein